MSEIKKPFYLSASSSKSFEQCSLRYFYNKILKIPEPNNDGALQGSVCHTVLELLLKPRHRAKFDYIYKNETIIGCESIEKYVRKYIKDNKLPEASLDRISKFITCGVKFDFFCEGGKIEGVEIPFEISADDGSYHVRGYIDKIASYPNGFLRVLDFKSSKQFFSGKDLEQNIQALIYSLAVRKLYPHLSKKIIVDFIFLAFPDNPKQRFPTNGKPISDDTLTGLEEYLKDVYSQMASFGAADRFNNVAAEKGYPDKESGFCGKIVCGYSKYPGHANKESKEYYKCPFKFQRDYFILLDENGEQIQTAINKEDLKPEKGQKIITKNFPGCEHYNGRNKEFDK